MLVVLPLAVDRGARLAVLGAFGMASTTSDSVAAGSFADVDFAAEVVVALRLITFTLSGNSSTTLNSEAGRTNSSFSLINSHGSCFSPRPFIRINAHLPLSL